MDTTRAEHMEMNATRAKQMKMNAMKAKQMKMEWNPTPLALTCEGGYFFVSSSLSMENDECACTPSLAFYAREGFLSLIVVGTTIIDPDMQNGQI
jgi:hypothetical protein